jgi:hypothetical protein
MNYREHRPLKFSEFCDFTHCSLIDRYEITWSHIPLTAIVIPQTEAQVSQIALKFFTVGNL